VSFGFDLLPVFNVLCFLWGSRGAYVMSVVTPAERPAAASFTAVPRSLASSLSPSIAGALFAAGAMATPLVLCGVLKSVYDVALLVMFRKVPPQD
jgi:hypothetical protein